MDYVLLGVGLLLIIGTGLFVASEFALVTLDRAELQARQERGETRLALTISALKITSTHLSAAQLGITLTTLLTGFTMEPALSRLLSPVLVGIGLPEPAVPVVAVIVAVTVATTLSMILGELIPKNFALAVPVATAKLVMPFQAAFTTVFRPLVLLLNGTANLVLRFLGVVPKEELSGSRSAEELSSLVRRSAMAGLLEKDTATLLDRTLTFTRLTASDVMTPRPAMEAIGVGESAADIISRARKSGLSRFPVFDESLDDIVGVVHLKSAVSVPKDRRGDVPAGALASPALRVPETAHLDSLLGTLRSRDGYQMAIVVDEYGGTSGMVTLEDLVEEIIGEITDEHDRARAGIVRSRGTVTFPATLRPDELLERSGVLVPEGDVYDTVAGFMMSELGRVPTRGDRVVLEYGVLEVIAMDGHRVDRVRFTPKSAQQMPERDLS